MRKNAAKKLESHPLPCSSITRLPSSGERWPYRRLNNCKLLRCRGLGSDQMGSTQRRKSVLPRQTQPPQGLFSHVAVGKTMKSQGQIRENAGFAEKGRL